MGIYLFRKKYIKRITHTELKRYALPWLPWKDCNIKNDCREREAIRRLGSFSGSEPGTSAYLGYQLVMVGEVRAAVGAAVRAVGRVEVGLQVGQFAIHRHTVSSCEIDTTVMLLLLY